MSPPLLYTPSILLNSGVLSLASRIHDYEVSTRIFTSKNIITLPSSLVVLAASPEGNLYYWGNALQDTPPMVRASVDVGEGHSLALDGLGHTSRFLLATTLGTLFLISPPLLSQTQVWGVRLGMGPGNETGNGLGNETGNETGKGTHECG